MDVETAIFDPATAREAVSEAVQRTLATGLYRRMPAAEYHAIDAASSHRLSLLARSPAHLRYAIDNPTEPTPAMQFGSLVHTAVLEPDQLGERFAVAPECDRRTNAGKAAWGEFCAANAGKTIVDPDDYCRAMSAAAAVYAHPAARALLDARTETELSAVWDCRRTGVRCKLRADMLTVDADGVPCVADLKTTEDASAEAFSRSILNFGYHRQSSHYLTGLASSGEIRDRYYFVVVEKSPPFAVAVYRLSDEALIVGDDEVMGLLLKYAQCVEHNEWRGFPDTATEISLPNWRMKQLDTAF